MKHSINELYAIDGKGTYHQSYLNSIDTTGCHIIHKHFIINNPKKDGAFYYITAEGKVKAWLYGEKTWFDTKEERDEYRAQCRTEMAEKARRKALIDKVLNYCEGLSDEELANFLSKIDG